MTQMETAPQRAREILLVEDSLTDIKMLFLALNKSGRKKNIATSADGEQAMAFLDGRTEGARPDLIILDLNLPKKDGWQVLAECKSDPRLRCIPIVVFTTSGSQRDVDRCYALGANSYVTKPFDLDAFQDAVGMIEDFWLGLSAPWVQG
jgi:two-component system, chemotaxis family, response regulator Rcp1